LWKAGALPMSYATPKKDKGSQIIIIWLCTYVS
jgi:hypothetical protein